MLPRVVESGGGLYMYIRRRQAFNYYVYNYDLIVFH